MYKNPYAKNPGSLPLHKEKDRLLIERLYLKAYYSELAPPDKASYFAALAEEHYLFTLRDDLEESKRHVILQGQKSPENADKELS